MRPRPIALVASRELASSLRSRWFVLAAGGFFALSLGLALLGFAGSDRSGMTGFDRTTASLLNLALLFVPLLTLSVGGLSLAGELEDGALGALLAQPLTRAEVYLGKFAGLYLSVASAVLAGFGATGVLIAVFSGGGSLAVYLKLLAMTLLLAAATLALGTLLSAAFRSRAKVVGAAFFVWLFLVYGSDMGTIGLAASRELSPGQVFALALLNPVQQARVIGTLAFSDRLDLLGPAGLWGQDAFGAVGMVVVLAAALAATCAAALSAGYAVFRKAVVP